MKRAKPGNWLDSEGIDSLRERTIVIGMGADPPSVMVKSTMGGGARGKARAPRHSRRACSARLQTIPVCSLAEKPSFS